MPAKLSNDNIQTSLQQLHADWLLQSDGGLIKRIFHFDNYSQTMSFANAVAWIAHQQDHHPQMLITYKSCQIDFYTHTVSGLTELDFRCARAIDNLFSD